MGIKNTLQYVVFGAGEGNRTLAFGLGSRCSAIELHPHIFAIK